MRSNRYIRQPKYAEQIRAKKKTSATRNRYIFLQVVVFVVIFALLISAVSMIGNKTLADLNVENSDVLKSLTDISVSGKVDNSFLVQQLGKELSSTNAILIDLASEEVIAEKHPDDKVYPASMTKVMTAIIVLEHFDDVTVQIEMPADMYPYLREQNASVAGFLPGEKVQIIDLLYGVLLPSGADACLSLARAVSGSEAAFANDMTKKAHEIGAVNTNFVNSTGLHDDNHYTTYQQAFKGA